LKKSKRNRDESMKIVVKDKIYIKYPTQEVKDWVQTHLIYTNPQFKYDQTVSPTITTFQIKDDTIILPRGVLNRFPFEINENQSVKVPLETVSLSTFNKTLRDYQERSVNDLKKQRQGILQAPCGSGKTVIALALLQRLGQKTLILVDELKLMRQWFESIVNDLGIPEKSVGQIGESINKTEEITIGMFQTIRNLNETELFTLSSKFGLVIVDECHIVPAKTIYRTVNHFESYYRFGLTATPKRRDGLEFLLFDTIGPIVSKISSQELVNEEVYVPVIVVPIFTNITYFIQEPKSSSAKLYWRKHIIDRLIRDETRNRVIIQKVLQQSGVHLVLSERIDHCKYLASEIGKYKKTELLLGEVKAEERERIRKDSSIEVIVGTSVADKGLDIPQIQHIHLTIPTTNTGTLTQRIGRGRRPWDDKEYCYVYDYIDNDTYFKKIFYNRINFYKKQNFYFSKISSLF